MLVYGDVEERCSAAGLAAQAADRLAATVAMAPGLARHMALVAAFLGLADLLRCRLDQQMPEADDLPADPAGMTALLHLAHAVDRSFFSDFADLPDLAPAVSYLRTETSFGDLLRKPLEGHAFYALYPESFAAAARQSGLPPQTRVIGLRSIGVGLAAMVASGLGAAPPLTLRPRGHPFDRHLDLTPALETQLLSDNPPAFAVVDEGPGLSGSSFGCVADWLADHGVDRARIHFFPGHLRLGPRASPERQAHWQAAPRHVTSTDELLRDRLPRWVADQLDIPCLDLEEITGRASEAPSAPAFERRKFLAHLADGSRWVLRFAGLGDAGAAKLELARHLEASGFGPPTAGLLHGFLLQRWLDAPSLCDAPLPRLRLVDQLAAYLACRAELPVAPEAGATLARLFEMARHNTAEALGPDAAVNLAACLGDPAPLEHRVRRVWVDARLHRWEWLVSNGRLIKLDATDHARAHDFIGAQDIAWDVAGASLEHDLDAAETERLIAALSSRGVAVDPALLNVLRPCYLAFQLGWWSMGAGPEASVTDAYAQRLAALLSRSPVP